MPALRMAEEGLANLNKNKLAEVKSFVTPPAGIDVVLSAIMILLRKNKLHFKWKINQLFLEIMQFL